MTRLRILAIAFATLIAARAYAQPSFPGAEGFGAIATGGRGGRVIAVTTLESSGPGSLQDALDVCEPRIIVFRVSGVIEGDVEIPCGDVTIAGQSAPCGGIAIAGQLFLYRDYDEGADNVVIRHVRVRPPRPGPSVSLEQYDAIQGGLNTTRIMLDHMSVCCGADETVDLYTSDVVTVQWTDIEEAAEEDHPDGHAHNYGFIQGPDEGGRISIHHSLFASHLARSPAIANGPADVINNVVHNVRLGFLHNNPARGQFNLIGNTFQQGPNDDLIPFYFDDEEESEPTSYFISDNFIDDPGEVVRVVDDPWNDDAEYFGDIDPYGYVGPETRADARFDFRSEEGYVPVSVQAHAQAFEDVLTYVGAFPRDTIVRRVVQEVRDREGSFGSKYPDLQEGLTSCAPPDDADGDGMADAWERDHGLDPEDPDDHSSARPSGYTAIEDYLAELAENITGMAPPPPADGGVPLPDAGPSARRDGGRAGDAGAGEVAGGCGCRASAVAPHGLGWLDLATVIALSRCHERRRRRYSGPAPKL
jgi:pectate lyase